MPKFTFLYKCLIYRKHVMLFPKKEKITYQGSLDKSYVFENITKWGLQTSYRQKKITILQHFSSIFEPCNMVPLFSSINEKPLFFLIKKTFFKNFKKSTVPALQLNETGKRKRIGLEKLEVGQRENELFVNKIMCQS